MRAAIDGSASLIRIDVLAFVCVLFVCVCGRVCVCVCVCVCACAVMFMRTHTPVQLCLISILSGNHQVTLQGPSHRRVAQEHIVL